MRGHGCIAERCGNLRKLGESFVCGLLPLGPRFNAVFDCLDKGRSFRIVSPKSLPIPTPCPGNRDVCFVQGVAYVIELRTPSAVWGNARDNLSHQRGALIIGFWTALPGLAI